MSRPMTSSCGGVITCLSYADSFPSQFSASLNFCAFYPPRFPPGCKHLLTLPCETKQKYCVFFFFFYKNITHLEIVTETIFGALIEQSPFMCRAGLKKKKGSQGEPPPPKPFVTKRIRRLIHTEPLGIARSHRGIVGYPREAPPSEPTESFRF